MLAVFLGARAALPGRSRVERVFHVKHRASRDGLGTAPGPSRRCPSRTAPVRRAGACPGRRPVGGSDRRSADLHQELVAEPVVEPSTRVHQTMARPSPGHARPRPRRGARTPPSTPREEQRGPALGGDRRRTERAGRDHLELSTEPLSRANSSARPRTTSTRSNWRTGLPPRLLRNSARLWLASTSTIRHSASTLRAPGRGDRHPLPRSSAVAGSTRPIPLRRQGRSRAHGRSARPACRPRKPSSAARPSAATTCAGTRRRCSVGSEAAMSVMGGQPSSSESPRRPATLPGKAPASSRGLDHHVPRGLRPAERVSTPSISLTVSWTTFRSAGDIGSRARSSPEPLTSCTMPSAKRRRAADRFSR